eukprot:5470120-Alexandrium_andersonii.AAC.1
MVRSPVESPIGLAEFRDHETGPRCPNGLGNDADLPPPVGGQSVPQVLVHLTAPLLWPPAGPADPDVHKVCGSREGVAGQRKVSGCPERP